MRYRCMVVALCGMFGAFPSVANAHFTLVDPPSAVAIDDGGKGAPPCGEGPASNVVTKVQGGRPLNITLIETTIHPGHYRVALSVRSRSELPPDPDVVVEDGISVSAAIQDQARRPVLADGLFVHTNAPPRVTWQTALTLPNINCARCTLQVIEFMAEHGPNVGGGYFYHHCADLQIEADPAAGPVDRDWDPRAVEFYHAGFDHYFISANPAEVQALDDGTFSGWGRTGLSFNVYPAGTNGTQDVCRFFSLTFDPKSSHFYTPSQTECQSVKSNPNWLYEGIVFALGPAGAGNCPGGTQQLFRLYNDGQGGAPNHRYTTDATVRSAMLARGWIAEGVGALGVIGCVPVPQ